MIKLSKLADYAVVLLCHMARAHAPTPETLFSTQQLAEASGLPLPTVSKILKSLVKHGLLCSTRGAQGGYRLGRSAHMLSIADIIEAVDGPIAITACTEHGGHDCAIETICPTKPHWQTINHTVRAALDSITIAQLATGSAAASSTIATTAQGTAVHTAKTPAIATAS